MKRIVLLAVMAFAMQSAYGQATYEKTIELQGGPGIDKNTKYRVTYNGHSVADIDVYEYGLSGDYPVQHLSCRLYNGDYMNFRALPQTTTVKVHVEETFRMGWVQEVYRLASPLTKIEIDDGTQLGARP